MAKVNEDLPGLQSLMADKLPPLPRNKNQKPIYDIHADKTPRDKDLGRGKDADSVDAPRIGYHNVDSVVGDNGVSTTRKSVQGIPRGLSTAMSNLSRIIETEMGLDIEAIRIKVSVSEDVSLMLHALASHSCPMGLLVSAMVRHYITNNLPEMEALLRYNKKDN